MKMRSVLSCSVLCGLILSAPVFADRLDQMISPVIDPVNFEDPRTNTEIRPIYIYHEIQNDFVTKGGNAQVYAVQLRYALDERLAIIANKDGWVDFNPHEVLTDQEGFGNLAGGLKYAFYRDGEAGSIMTAGVTYEAPTGEKEVFQGTGDGFVKPIFSSAFALSDTVNFMASTDLRIPIDEDDSTYWDFNFHIDTQLCDFYPLLELNIVQVMDEGNRLPIKDEGADYFNFGAADSQGETIITAAVGGRYKIADWVNYGLAFQFPLDRGDGANIFDWRITTDFIFSIN